MTVSNEPRQISDKRKILVCAGLAGGAAPLLSYLINTLLLEMSVHSNAPIIVGTLTNLFWPVPLLFLAGVTSLLIALPFMMAFNAGLYIALTSLYLHLRNHGPSILSILPFAIIGSYWLLQLSLAAAILFGVTKPSAGPVTAIKYTDSFGPALQAGIDYALDEHWSLNVDVKKIWIQTDVAINGGAIKADVSLDPWIVGIGFGYRL